MPRWRSFLHAPVVLIAVAGFAMTSVAMASTAEATRTPAGARTAAVAVAPNVDCTRVSCYFRYFNQADGLCLGMPGTASGTQAIQFTCNSNDSQYWQFASGSQGTLLKNLHTGLCLDIKNNDPDPGGAVVQVLRISEIPHCRSLEFPRGRAVRRAWDELTGLSSRGLLTGQLGDGDGLVAGGAAAAGSGPAHECSALVAALVPEGAVAAAAAFVDGARPPGAGFGDDDGCLGLVAAPPVGECPAGAGAELAPAGRGERVLADRAGCRDAIVTRRGHQGRDGVVTRRGSGPGGGHALATARRVASARARWDRIR